MQHTVKRKQRRGTTRSGLEPMVIVTQDPYAYIDPAVRACHTGTKPRHFSVWRSMHTLHEGIR